MILICPSCQEALRWRVFWQERECECIAARPQCSNGGAILPCMLEVSKTHVEGEERRAACCQHSNTEAFDCSSLGFWIFFPILKNYCNAGHFAGCFSQHESILPGVETQWCSGGCSTNVSGLDVVVAHTWLQRRAFLRASRCSGAGAAAALMSPGVTWGRHAPGCRGIKTQQPDVPGHDVAAAHTWLQCRGFARSRDAAAQWRLQRQCPQA